MQIVQQEPAIVGGDASKQGFDPHEVSVKRLLVADWRPRPSLRDFAFLQLGRIREELPPIVVRPQRRNPFRMVIGEGRVSPHFDPVINVERSGLNGVNGHLIDAHIEPLV